MGLSPVAASGGPVCVRRLQAIGRRDRLGRAGPCPWRKRRAKRRRWRRGWPPDKRR